MYCYRQNTHAPHLADEMEEEGVEKVSNAPLAAIQRRFTNWIIFDN